MVQSAKHYQKEATRRHRELCSGGRLVHIDNTADWLAWEIGEVMSMSSSSTSSLRNRDGPRQQRPRQCRAVVADCVNGLRKLITDLCHLLSCSFDR